MVAFRSGPGHAAGGQRGQNIHQQSSFDDLDPLVQGGFVVVVEHRNRLLGQDRPGVGARVDEMHACSRSP